MAGLPDELNFQKEEFAAQMPWIEPLIRRLNLLSSQIRNSLTSLAIGSNIPGQIYSHTFTMPASGFDSFTFAVTMSSKPRALILGGMQKFDDPSTTFTTACFPSWQLVDKDGKTHAKVNHITGLTASTKYTATFVLLP